MFQRAVCTVARQAPGKKYLYPFFFPLHFATLQTQTSAYFTDVYVMFGVTSGQKQITCFQTFTNRNEKLIRLQLSRLNLTTLYKSSITKYLQKSPVCFTLSVNAAVL